MKILLVYPKFKKYLETNPKILEAIKEPLYAGYKTTPALGIPILTALKPPPAEKCESSLSPRVLLPPASQTGLVPGEATG